MSMQNSEPEWLSRKEAADYLTKRGYRTSVATLAKLACFGEGPIYSGSGPQGGGPVRYHKIDLDSWAQSTNTPPKAKRMRAAIAGMGALSRAARAGT